MSIPYRTRRVLNRIGTLIAVLAIGVAVFWLCWVVWLQRYVVYGDAGVRLDMEHSAYGSAGEVALPPKAEQKVTIFYNEGADAINAGNELTQLNGYYITNNMIKDDLDTVLTNIERLPAGTPVMIDMKGPYGSFFYDSKLKEALRSQSTDIAAMTSLVDRLKTKGFYTIARISAFRDYNFGLNHVPSGLYMLNRAGLWMDKEGMYWLDPTSATTTSWISSVIMELKEMGFNEVLLADFRFPDSDQYIFSGNKDEALQKAADVIISTCAAADLTISFLPDYPAFPLPEGRCRLYLQDVPAASVDAKASMVEFEDRDIRLVFLTATGDTRYESYGVLYSILVAEQVEARKGN